MFKSDQELVSHAEQILEARLKSYLRLYQFKLLLSVERQRYDGIPDPSKASLTQCFHLCLHGVGRKVAIQFLGMNILLYEVLIETHQDVLARTSISDPLVHVTRQQKARVALENNRDGLKTDITPTMGSVSTTNCKRLNVKSPKRRVVEI